MNCFHTLLILPTCTISPDTMLLMPVAKNRNTVSALVMWEGTAWFLLILFKSCKIKPVNHFTGLTEVDNNINFRILLLTYKCINKSTTQYFQELICAHWPACTLLSSSALQLIQPTQTTSYGHLSFSFSATALWNAHPHHIRTVPTENNLKALLKTHFFSIILAISL